MIEWKISGFPGGPQRKNLADYSSKALIFIAFTVTILGAWAQRWQIEAVLDRLASLQWGFAYLITARTLFYINASAFLWRLVLVCFYRPTPACRDEDLPTCTVVIPAYNEGRHVAETIDSVAASDYPADKIEIISGDMNDVDFWKSELNKIDAFIRFNTSF